MIIVGTTANVVFLVTALILAAHDFPVWAYVSVFFIPLPYNFFIWQCVWTAAGRSELGQRLFVRTIASIWMLIVIVA